TNSTRLVNSCRDIFLKMEYPTRRYNPELEPSGVASALSAHYLSGHAIISHTAAEIASGCPTLAVKGMTTTALPNTVPADPEERRILLHGPEEFEGMRKAGRLAAETLDFITPHVRPGVTTEELDRLCHEFIVGH